MLYLESLKSSLYSNSFVQKGLELQTYVYNNLPTFPVKKTTLLDSLNRKTFAQALTIGSICGLYIYYSSYLPKSYAHLYKALGLLSGVASLHLYRKGSKQTSVDIPSFVDMPEREKNQFQEAALKALDSKAPRTRPTFSKGWEGRAVAMLKAYQDKDLGYRAGVFSIMQQALSDCTSQRMNLTLAQKTAAALCEAVGERRFRDIPAVKIVEGGEKFCVFAPGNEEFILKILKEDKDSREEYLMRVQKSRDASKNLSLLYVPSSKKLPPIIEMGDNKLVKIGLRTIVEERIHFFGGSTWNHQEAVYSWLQNVRKLDDYCKTVFSQLATFIVTSNCSDIKPDNLPLSTEGRVILLDPDNDSALEGLTSGICPKRPSGLFNLAHSNHHKMIINIVRRTNLCIALQLPPIDSLGMDKYRTQVEQYMSSFYKKNPQTYQGNNPLARTILSQLVKMNNENPFVSSSCGRVVHIDKNTLVERSLSDKDITQALLDLKNEQCIVSHQYFPSQSSIFSVIC